MPCRAYSEGETHPVGSCSCSHYCVPFTSARSEPRHLCSPCCAAFLNSTDGPPADAIRARYLAARARTDPLKLSADIDVPYKDVPNAIHPGADADGAAVDKEPYAGV